ncbi:nucleolar protein 4 [Platysternon megacephalum]|uniref:Nicotinate phosphoribosyltransferase n=1 Tax=Platysternon megacephalum TaxID=55544 RepID=A0A4D9DYD3_9SAUR|nr:nucleolar protein 4 [Platysternon megacephalum]
MEPGRRDSLALLTDLYQVTMAYGYWRAGRQREPAEFELFFRRCPFAGGFALSAGLGECLAFLRGFRLRQPEIEYLQSVLPSTVEKAFFDYLRTVDASEVTVSSAPEGSIVFATVPLLQVKGPLLVVQLLETTLLCLVNYASLVVTNAARFRMLAGPDKKLLELGLRRAQGPDGGVSASKYSYIGGFDWTSNVLAGKLYGVPVRGTVAHSYIMSFTSLAEVQPRALPKAAIGDDVIGTMEVLCPMQTLKPLDGDEPVDFLPLAESWLRRVCQTLRVPHDRVNHGELAAFVSYAIAFPHNFQGLVDTYSVMGSGIPNFCALALALNQLGYRVVGIRVDSGDLGKQAREIRQGNEIDMIGIGTNLVTCPLQPSLGCVYKLVTVNGCPRLKLTEDEEKMTIPGSKVVYRLYDATGLAFMDLMALKEEPPPRAGQEVAVRLLGRSEEARRVTPTALEILHRAYFKDGQQVCQALPSLLEIKSHAQASLSMLSPAHKRLQDPEPYQVAVTEKLHSLLNDLRRSSQMLSPPVERAAEDRCGTVTPLCLSKPLSPTIPLSDTLCWESRH